MNPAKQLLQHGQSVWLDFISRELLIDGQMEHLVNEVGVRGLTSNPTIFAKAISEGADYNEGLAFFMDASPEADAKALYEALAVADIQSIADILRPVYEESCRVDGMVSLEVSPDAAFDTRTTILEARHLWKGIHRPNAMIKIPATKEGIPAIETCISEGININATLIFSVEQYEQVAQAYICGLEKSILPSHVTSVASFFVSRIDTAVDHQLEEMGTPQAQHLLGQIAIANSKVAYQRFQDLFNGGDFQRESKRGARVQRLLWASTSAKNPAYRDTMYVEELVGQDTVNTMPMETLEAFVDHGKVRSSLQENMDQAPGKLQQLQELGIDFREITDQLLRDGVKAFADSFAKTIGSLEQKRQYILSGQVYR
jgi:transaldolase